MTNNQNTMDKIRYHIPQFILWVLFWLLVVCAMIYLSGIGDKIDKIYSLSNRSISCDTLPYWVQDKIEKTYENITSFECTTNP